MLGLLVWLLVSVELILIWMVVLFGVLKLLFWLRVVGVSFSVMLGVDSNLLSRVLLNGRWVISLVLFVVVRWLVCRFMMLVLMLLLFMLSCWLVMCIRDCMVILFFMFGI